MAGATDDASVIGALTGMSGGSLPRRVVIAPDGSLADRGDHPKIAEVTTLSLVCEAVRRSAGKPVYSRHTATLTQQCLDGNDREAWEAMLADVRSGDFCHVDAGAAMEVSSRCIVHCIVAATPGQHAWAVVRAARHLLPLLSDTAARHTADVFLRLFPEVVSAMSKKCRDVSGDERAMSITALGRVMAWCDIPVPRLSEMLQSCASKADDVLRLFLWAPMPEICAHAPGLVDMLVARADKAPQASKYPACALLALLPVDALRPHADAIRRLGQRVLETASAQGSMDPKLALACAALLKAVSAPRSLELALAHALMCLSAAVLGMAPPPSTAS